MIVWNFYLLSYVCITVAADRLMTGVHVNIAVYNEPPLFTIRRNPANASQVKYAGISHEIFDLLSNTLNFTYTYVEVPLSVVKTKGTIEDALVDELVQNRVDVNGRIMSPTIRRLGYMEFTVAVAVVQFSLIQPMPQIRNRFLAAIKPFQSSVWCAIVIAFVTTGVFLTVASFYAKSTVPNRRLARGKYRVASNNAWYAFDVLMMQGAYLPTRQVSLRWIAGAWCLTAFVLVYAYNSTLISYISLPKYESVVNNWEEMANSKTLRLVTSKGSILSEIMLNAETGVLKTLGDSLRAYPKDLIMNYPGEVDTILKSGCCAYVEVKTMCLILIYRSLLESGGKCRLTIGKDLDFTQFVSIGVAKNFPYLRKFNEGLLKSREAGLFAKMSTNYVFKSVDKCIAKQVERPKDSKLNLVDLSTAFILISLGCCASFAAFILEIIVSKFEKNFHGKQRRVIVL